MQVLLTFFNGYHVLSKQYLLSTIIPIGLHLPSNSQSLPSYLQEPFEQKFLVHLFLSSHSLSEVQIVILQSLSTVLLQPKGQQPSLDWHTLIAEFEHNFVSGSQIS